MAHVTRTTITIPSDTLRNNTSVSTLIIKNIEKELGQKEKGQGKNPMRLLGVLSLGIDKLYDSRDDLYEDELKRKMGI